MVKDFISDQDGLYKDPFNAAVIKGEGNTTDLIAQYVSNPFFVLDAYGNAQYTPPNTSKIKVPGETAVEIPYNNNDMNYQYAQAGGATSQQQQIIQQVAQMLQQGADPQQVMQQLVQMGIPSQQAEQLLTAVIQQMQSQMQEEEMGEEEMPMAMAGGKACIDCEEEFPQAQNLNWFYKAQEGGERFPQANPYPHMYADGGAAQTYLPYDRGNEPVPNFMFEYGGTTDIDRAYRLMKAGGFDMDPRKKKGGKFTGESFQEYVMRNGGDLPMHQGQRSQTGLNPFLQNLNLQPRAIPGVTPAQAPYQYSPQVKSVINPRRAGTNYVMDRNPYAGQPGITLPEVTITGSRRSAGTGSASGVRRAPAASGPGISSIQPNVEDEGVGMGQGFTRAEKPGLYGETTTTAASEPNINSIQPIYSDRDIDEYGAPPDDDSIPPGLTRKEQRQMARDFRRQRRGDSYFNPQAAYYSGQAATKMFGDKGAAGLALLSGLFPGAASAMTSVPSGGLFGGKSKFKMNLGVPGGTGFLGLNRWDLNTKGNAADILAQRLGVMPQPTTPATSTTTTPTKLYGGGNNPGDFKYTYRDQPQGLENYAAALSFQSGALDAIQAAKQQKAQENMLMNRDTISSGIMGPIAAADKAMGPSGTINMPGAINPYLTGQPGNFGFNQFQPSMLQNQMVKFGGDILDQFEDGGVYDLDGMNDEDVREFVNAIYAAGGSVDFL